MVMSSGVPVASLPYVDEETSQANLADLMASQSSPEELEAAYERVESRCVQAVSRNVSPSSSQRSSLYSPEYPSPVSPTFGSQVPLPTAFGFSSSQVPSPCSSPRSSVYSSECPTPTHQAYSDQQPFAVAYTAPLQEFSPAYPQSYGTPCYRPLSYDGNYGSGKGADGLSIDTGGWGWGNTVESPVMADYPRKFNRSWSY